MLAEEGDTHMQIISAEVVLSQQHTQTPDPKVHTQAIAEPEVTPGKPGAIKRQPGDLNANTPKGVAYRELDSMSGEDITNNACTHLKGTEPETLLEKEGIAKENASVKEDSDPRIELQESGVSHLATLEEDKFLTTSSSLPSTTSKAARMQHSLAINTGMSAIPEPEDSADLEPPPDEGTKPPDCHLHEQSQAPTEAGGQSELPPGETSQCMMGHMGLTSVQTHDGQMAIGEVHGHPPDLPNLQGHSSTIWGQSPSF